MGKKLMGRERPWQDTLELLSGQRGRVRGTVHPVCQSSKDKGRAWGQRSALTLSPTSATRWLWHRRQVSPLSASAPPLYSDGNNISPQQHSNCHYYVPLPGNSGFSEGR